MMFILPQSSGPYTRLERAHMRHGGLAGAIGLASSGDG